MSVDNIRNFFELYGGANGACISPEVLKARIQSAEEASVVSDRAKSVADTYIATITAQFLKSVPAVKAAYPEVSEQVRSWGLGIEDKIIEAEEYALTLQGKQ